MKGSAPNQYANIHALISALKVLTKWIITLLIGVLISVPGYVLPQMREADQTRIRAAIPVVVKRAGEP